MSFLKDRLDNSEIRKELEKPLFPLELKLRKKRIDDIVQQFWFYDYYNSLISFPPYLKYLKRFLLIEGNKKFTRSEFYRFFLEKIIIKTNKKLKILQKIAAVMELMQINDLPIKDFKKLLKKLNITWGKLEIENLLKENLLKFFQEENKPKSIGFYHHTIQEYLTASFILTTK